MDAFAVSVASGVCLRTVSIRQTFRLSWHFGFFQAMMPVIGWAGGIMIRSALNTYAHWVAFALLGMVALKMIRDAFEDTPTETSRQDPTRGFSLVMLSVATSIDALAVGFSISMLKTAIWLPAAVIGLVAGGFTAAGLHLGCRIGAISCLRRFAEIIGGMVLMGIGIRILHEHGGLAWLLC